MYAGFLLCPHIFLAAIIHYLDPVWNTNQIRKWTEALIQDVNCQASDNADFAQFRNWDWFAGHSWAGGIKVNGALDGRDQESVPEVSLLYVYTMNSTTYFFL